MSSKEQQQVPERSNGENGAKNSLIIPTKFFVGEISCELLMVQDYMVADPMDIRAVIFKYAIGEGVCEYELGCMLLRVKEESLWKRKEFSRNSTEPYSSFGNWVYGEMNMSHRKARHLLFIARKLLEMKADPAFIRKLILLGWTKAYQVLRVAENLQDVTEWYKKAQKCGERELRDKVTLVMHTKKSVGGKAPAIIDAVPETRDFSPIEFSCSFMAKEDYEFVARARAIIAKRYGEEEIANDKFISLLAANYISTKYPGQGQEVVVELDEKIKAIEAEYGVRLAAVEVIHEEEILEVQNGAVPNQPQVPEGKAGGAV